MGCGASRSASPKNNSNNNNNNNNNQSVVPEHISQEIDKIDRNEDGRIDKDECQIYIDQNAQLWAMLSASCNIPTARCREIARDTAYTMAKKAPHQSFRDLNALELERPPTIDEFKQLFSKIHTDPQYQLEFFHRTVFCAFDQDGNGYLDSQELDAFLDIFYDVKSSFAGDVRLPHKQVLKKRVLQDLDANGDGRLDFEGAKKTLITTTEFEWRFSRSIDCYASSVSLTHNSCFVFQNFDRSFREVVRPLRPNRIPPIKRKRKKSKRRQKKVPPPRIVLLLLNQQKRKRRNPRKRPRNQRPTNRHLPRSKNPRNKWPAATEDMPNDRLSCLASHTRTIMHHSHKNLLTHASCRLCPNHIGRASRICTILWALVIGPNSRFFIGRSDWPMEERPIWERQKKLTTTRPAAQNESFNKHTGTNNHHEGIAHHWYLRYFWLRKESCAS